MMRLVYLLAMFVLSLHSADAQAQAGSPFPYAKEWTGKRYGPVNPWLSVSTSAGFQKTRFAVENFLEAPNATAWHIESRYHLNPRLALVAGLKGDVIKQVGGKTIDTIYQGPPGVINGVSRTAGQPIKVDYDYEARQGHIGVIVGADFGLIEREYWHIQAGPRLGLLRYKSTLSTELETEGLDEDDIQAELAGGQGSFSDPMAGVSIRIGGFFTPGFEIGIELQTTAIMGVGEASSDGFYVPGLSVLPGGAMYTTLHL